jgi:hypothetical protein
MSDVFFPYALLSLRRGVLESCNDENRGLMPILQESDIMKFPHQKSKISVVDYAAGSGKGAEKAATADKVVINRLTEILGGVKTQRPSSPPKEPALFEKVFMKNKDAMDILAGGPDMETLEFQIWAAQQKLVMV